MLCPVLDPGSQANSEQTVLKAELRASEALAGGGETMPQTLPTANSHAKRAAVATTSFLSKFLRRKYSLRISRLGFVQEDNVRIVVAA